MKYLVALAFVLYVCEVGVLAQAPPPPPPLIYKAPEKTDFKEFISEDKTFQITFAGAPKVTNQTLEYGALTSYRVYKQSSNSIVNVIELNKGQEQLENNKQKFYDLIGGQFLKVPKTTIEAEKAVQIAGEIGKELDILQDYEYTKIRILIVGNRIYQLQNDVTNWHIINDSTKKAYNNETQRFFDSFKLIKDKQ